MPRDFTNFSCLRFAIGPEILGWRSWDWGGNYLAKSFSKHAQTATFPAWEERDTDFVFVIRPSPRSPQVS
jgi:hypothetical protein